MIKFELILEKCSLLRVIVFTLYALKINQFYNVSLEYFSCQVKCLKCECMHVNRPKQFSLHQSLCTSKKLHEEVIVKRQFLWQKCHISDHMWILL